MMPVFIMILFTTSSLNLLGTHNICFQFEIRKMCNMYFDVSFIHSCGNVVLAKVESIHFI